ncbi:transferrin receptor protein 1-like [Cheilinus undulatus]|uniref:transferrin receptor protein 1-like n=1 Tax=Cheilinus undulatus TaxID=241271 RepID=UPI001BD2F669|nr:transferrin receptor protein 1-like [Cheilinus undulatus]
MERIRSAFNRVINSERSSSFPLQPEEDGERHDEVKLSDDGTETDDGQAGGSPSFRPVPPHQSRRTVCYCILATILIFMIGYMFGFISHQTASCDLQLSVEKQTSKTPTQDPVVVPVAPNSQMDWADVTELLTQKLSSQAFDKTLSEFDQPKRPAGSDEDISMANRIFNEFKTLQMAPWTNIYYVQLQKPDSTRPNRVSFGPDVFEPKGYLAYSAPKRVQGKLVYGNYGRQKDLDFLKKKSIELEGSVLLLRAGNITFAEQVNIAAANGAAAVLIYPDIQDFKYVADTELYGHVHMGSGDPYTPGFPSFNHTQFPPTKSSGLPEIPAQTITANMALSMLQKIGGPEADAGSGFEGGLESVTYRLGGSENVTIEVNNVLVNTKIHNVFGVIKGFTDPDHYIVLGAQRDAWGQGYARAAVGSAVLLELAKAFQEMVEKDGFRPRRSLVFASWSAGEYGSVGATEWLEGYMSSIEKRAFTYINLDGVVMGRGSFIASSSPLLYSLLESTMKEVKSPIGSGSLYDLVGKSAWQANVLRPMSMDDSAYPFLASSGIPSVSFHFISPDTEKYIYYGTNLDNLDHLNYQTSHRTGEITALAAEFAGRMALRLVHDHLLRLNPSQYSKVFRQAVIKVYKRINQLKMSGQLKDVTPTWLIQAYGSFQRAAAAISNTIQNADLSNPEACRIINDRIIMVEHSLLSPYVSPTKSPFRHILLGQGSHTIASIVDITDMQQLHTELALAIWTLQGCADAMMGDIWYIDNEI